MNMRITDINMHLGGCDAENVPVTQENLLAALDDYQIDCAVCYHEYAKLDPLHGNTLMAEAAAASNGRLSVCAVLDPILGRSCLPGQGNLTERLKAFRPACIRIFPENARTVFHPFYWQEILDTANELSMPLIVDYDYTPEFFLTLPDVSLQYPAVKFVLIRYGLCRGRHVLPLLQRRDNVYFTMEHMLDNLQIEEIVEKCGYGKLLFGSGYPALPIGGALGLALYADISGQARQRILCDNWEVIRYDHP